MTVRTVALAASAALAIATQGCAPVTPPPETASSASVEVLVPAPRIRELPLAQSEAPRHELSYPYNLPQYTGGITAALETPSSGSESGDASSAR